MGENSSIILIIIIFLVPFNICQKLYFIINKKKQGEPKSSTERMGRQSCIHVKSA